MKALVTLALLLAATSARADAPCDAGVLDPIVTPVRDGLLDAQRSACLREDISAGLRAHALVDTPGFRGVLGGELVLAGRLVIAKAHELSAALSLFDYTFVQNAVNKITRTGVGPVVVGAAANGSLGDRARTALSLRIEVPYTYSQRDTFRTSAQLAGLVTGALSTRTTLHARLGAIGRFTSSLGGETQRLGLFAGSDVAWRVRTRLAIHGGAEVLAGWASSFDHLLVRAGVSWQRRDAWRLRAGVGLPVAGAERANAIVDLAIVIDR